MKQFGLELEFFVGKGKTIIPAFKGTDNLDGNPSVGELRTGIHSNIIDAIFELKKLIYIETNKLKNKGLKFKLISENTFSDDQINEIRKHCSSKKDYTEEISIYGEKANRVLEKGLTKASLQINISENEKFYYQNGKEQKHKILSTPFDYVSIIRQLDSLFEKDIISTNRLKGVFSIKEGENGKRIEYRSLPNTIDLLKLQNILK